MRESHTVYGTAYRTHQSLVEQLKKSRAATNELERLVEQSQMQLTRAQRMLLEDAQKA